MRSLPLVALVALSSGCFEYGLGPVNDTVDPAAGPSMSSDEAPVGPQDESFSPQGAPFAFDDEPATPHGMPGGMPVGSDVDFDMGLDQVESLDLKPGGSDDGLDMGLAPVESLDLQPGGSDDGLSISTDWWNDPWSEPPEGTPAGDEEGGDEGGGDEGGGDEGGGNGGGGTPHGGLARMTGGGQVNDEYGLIGHSFTVHCEWTHDTNQLNLDLGADGRFDLEQVNWVVCLDDPALDAQQPEPDFDTVVGTGWGTLDGQPATVWFVMTDNGEPCDSDWMRFEVMTDTDVFPGEGFLTQGNHQVHDPVGQL